MANRSYRTLLIGTFLTLGVGGSYLMGQHLSAVKNTPLSPIRLAQGTSSDLSATNGVLGTGKIVGVPSNISSTSHKGKSDAAPQDNSQAQETFDTVYGLVKENYYAKLPSDTKMSQGAVRAMVASLDDSASYFLEPEQYQLVRAEGRGKHEGIGAVLHVQEIPLDGLDGFNDHKIVVVAALPGSPAEKAGLKSGDIITQIEDRQILGYNPILKFAKIVKRFQNKEATEEEFEQSREATIKLIKNGIDFFPTMMLLRGDKTEINKLTTNEEKADKEAKAHGGSATSDAATKDNKDNKDKDKKEELTTGKIMQKIAQKSEYVLTVVRNGAKEPLKITVGTGITEVPALTSKILPDNTLYVKIPFFSETTGEEFEKTIKSLPGGCPGIVLDLRGNAGGFFEAAEKVNTLLGGGKVLATAIGAQGKRITFASDATPLIPHLAISVLVDKGTASTAEALAAALSDAQVATILGSNTFGDAQVVNLYTLADGSGFTLTTGKMISPKERSWAKTGLTPTQKIAIGLTESQILAQATTALHKATP